MKRKYLPFAMLVILVPLSLMTGCKSGNQKTPGSIDEKEAEDITNRLKTIKQVYHLCPSPAEMLSVIDVSDLSYNGELLNPVENADRYLDSRSKSLALGIYITDLAYAALFGRHEETLDYLETVRAVAEEIRVTGAINDELIQKAKNNIKYLDSLFSISNEAFINMLFFCERNNRPNTIIMLSSGAFVESLYLAVNMVDDYESAGYILQHLADQKYAIDNLMVFGESMSSSDPNITAVMEELRPLKEIYDGLDSGGGEMTVKTSDEAGNDQAPKKLVIGAGDSKPASISPDEFKKLKEETIRIRTNMVEG